MRSPDRNTSVARCSALTAAARASPKRQTAANQVRFRISLLLLSRTETALIQSVRAVGSRIVALRCGAICSEVDKSLIERAGRAPARPVRALSSANFSPAFCRTRPILRGSWARCHRVAASGLYNGRNGRLSHLTDSPSVRATHLQRIEGPCAGGHTAPLHLSGVVQVARRMMAGQTGVSHWAST